MHNKTYKLSGHIKYPFDHITQYSRLMYYLTTYIGTKYYKPIKIIVKVYDGK